MSKNIFFVGLILCASGLFSPPLALATGLVYGMIFTHPYHVDARKLSKLLLQVSVVGLGFGMNLKDVIHAGKSGFLYTAVSITCALALGWLLGRMLGVDAKISYLISTGTAICGGSAIAAIAPITQAGEEEIAISLATVFSLNSVALILFPLIGTALHLTQSQFGLWAALAIHDTSSVVGAGAKFGAVALAVGTTVKLARALWIVPLSVGTATLRKSHAQIQWPWFIALFCLAAAANSYLPQLASLWGGMKHIGMVGLTATLFLIGSGLTPKSLRAVGPRPLIQGILLWVVVASASLFLIRMGWIAI